MAFQPALQSQALILLLMLKQERLVQPVLFLRLGPLLFLLL
jgi:hypothetical protein